MDGDWDSLRTQLDFPLDPPYGMGDWFLVPESAIVRVKSGIPFAPQKARKGRSNRPVVLLADVVGPNARGYPRSSASKTSKSGSRRSIHPAHPQSHEGSCRINRGGRVVLGVPVTVSSDEICDSTYSCREPEETGLLAAIARRRRP